MTTPTIEITLSELNESWDWAEAFGEGAGGTRSTIESLDGTNCDPCPRIDVKRIIAAVNGEPDYAHWTGVFEMNDGRFLAVDAGCDYSGWL